MGCYRYLQIVLSFNLLIKNNCVQFNLRSSRKVIGRGPKYKNLHDNYYEDDLFVSLKQLVKKIYEFRFKIAPPPELPGGRDYSHVL